MLIFQVTQIEFINNYYSIPFGTTFWRLSFIKIKSSSKLYDENENITLQNQDVSQLNEQLVTLQQQLYNLCNRGSANVSNADVSLNILLLMQLFYALNKTNRNFCSWCIYLSRRRKSILILTPSCLSSEYFWLKVNRVHLLFTGYFASPFLRLRSAGGLCAMYPDLATQILCPGCSGARLTGAMLAVGTWQPIRVGYCGHVTISPPITAHLALTLVQATLRPELVHTRDDLNSVQYQS